MKVSVCSWQELDKSVWKDFIDQCEHSIQAQPEWIDAYCNHYGQDVNPSILVFEENGEVVGLQPFQFKTKQENRFYKRRRLIPLASGPTDFYQLLFKAGHLKACCDALVKWLTSQKNKWEVFELFELPQHNEGWKQLEESFKTAGFQVSLNTNRGYFEAHTTEEWEPFFESFIRPNNKDLLKDLRKLDRREIKLSIEQHSTKVYEKLLEVRDLYAQRRKALNQSNPYEEPELMSFLKEIIAKFETTGNVELSLLKDQDDNIWSFQLDWLQDGVRYHWNHAYNEDFKKFSPGKILLYMLLQQAFDNPELKACNHMRGLTGYKSKLADRKVATVSFEVKNHHSLRNKATKVLNRIRS